NGRAGGAEKASPVFGQWDARVLLPGGRDRDGIDWGFDSDSLMGTRETRNGKRSYSRFPFPVARFPTCPSSTHPTPSPPSSCSDHSSSHWSWLRCPAGAGTTG